MLISVHSKLVLMKKTIHKSVGVCSVGVCVGVGGWGGG